MRWRQKLGHGDGGSALWFISTHLSEAAGKADGREGSRENMYWRSLVAAARLGEGDTVIRMDGAEHAYFQMLLSTQDFPNAPSHQGCVASGGSSAEQAALCRARA